MNNYCYGCGKWSQLNNSVYCVACEMALIQRLAARQDHTDLGARK